MRRKALHRSSGHTSVGREGYLHSRTMAMGLIWRKIGDQSICPKCQCVVARLRGSSCFHNAIPMCVHTGWEKRQLSNVQSFPNEVMFTSK